MEGLHVDMEDAVYGGIFRGFCIGSSNLVITHMFYTDNALSMG